MEAAADFDGHAGGWMAPESEVFVESEGAFELAVPVHHPVEHGDGNREGERAADNRGGRARARDRLKQRRNFGHGQFREMRSSQIFEGCTGFDGHRAGIG